MCVCVCLGGVCCQTELFEEKDADKDGQMDAKEFRAMLQEDVHPEERMGEQHVQEIFKHADLNGDKKVRCVQYIDVAQVRAKRNCDDSTTYSTVSDMN